ncbi:MAG: prepilin-type N-terminal cleavage/methylation domain-containing protein [Candidatus Wallbacteria bacterium]|nr:prepilin-type N-terminal cleavage/methylation domain-containing protein [Candidatus Wallbacteria bacterium]
MTFLRTRRGFSLLELLIALSILIIMTGAATLYLGDILFKAKVAKAKNDMETFVTAVTLHDAEVPEDLLDTGLIGTSAFSRILATSVVEQETLANLVGTYLLALPTDPWQAGYKINAYSGYVKSYASDYALAGTSKYDKDIQSYYLPENLFLAKVRADDLNGNTILDTDDEIVLYFSKSVRCNANVNTVAATAYDGTAVAAANGTPYGIAVLDVHTNKTTERSDVDGNGYDATGLASATEHDEAVDAGIASWTAHDLQSYKPGDFDSLTPSETVLEAETILVGEAGGDEGAAQIAIRNTYGFHRPSDKLFYASAFDRRVKFWLSRTSEGRGSDSSHLDIGYELFIGTADDASPYLEAYSIWESSQAYGAYKTTGEKAKIYLQNQTVAIAKRTLVFKNIVD